MGADDPGAASIEEHLSTCEECAKEARLTFSFRRLVCDWSANSHGVAYAREQLAAGLDSAESAAEDSAIAERLRAWRQHWEGRAEACLRVLLGRVADAGQVVANGIDALTRSGSPMQFGEALATNPVRGAADARTDVILTSATPEGVRNAQVEVRGGASSAIVVRFDAARGAEPIVMLIPLAGGPATVRTAIATGHPGERGAVARFLDLPAGDYLVAIEPLD